jgi:UV DNA damage endonuclease
MTRFRGRPNHDLALKTDDRWVTPASLLPFCERLTVPLVYDVHHHLQSGHVDHCRPHRAGDIDTGDREPHFHISSPRDCWGARDTRPHADFVKSDDFPDAWRARRMTIDVEAKAKECSVLALREALSSNPANS